MLMDVIIVCHTEFGFVYNGKVIFDKTAIKGVKDGVKNLIMIADTYGAKVTFAVCPEVAESFPRNVAHEIGLHIHAGWQQFKTSEFRFYVGDSYLKKQYTCSINSTALRDYSYKDQYNLIETGKKYLEEKLGIEVKTFVAGRWSINNDTIRALINLGITHDCSALPHSKSDHYDWSRLPRICMPYHPDEKDYQKRGKSSLLVLPVSQVFPAGSVNPEIITMVGLKWLKACFREYFTQKLPFFHICLHSPCMTHSFFISALEELLEFISEHKGVSFKFASQIRDYGKFDAKTNIVPYLLAINKTLLKFLISSASRPNLRIRVLQHLISTVIKMN